MSDALVPVRRKIITVMKGPGVWVGLRGWLLMDDGEFVIGKFWSRDDAGEGVYNLRIPKACVTIEDEPIQA